MHARPEARLQESRRIEMANINGLLVRGDEPRTVSD